MTTEIERGACSHDVLLWADGSWCYRSELSEFTYLSDDYEAIYYYTDVWHHFHHDIDLSHRKYGVLGFMRDGWRRPLTVLKGAAGFYLGTLTDTGDPHTRESELDWPTRAQAEAGMTSGRWAQKLQS